MLALFLTVIVSAAGFLASPASASATSLDHRHILHGFLVRQTNPLAVIPTQCQPSCTTIFRTISAGCGQGSPVCVCTPPNAQLLEGCLVCITTVVPTAQIIASSETLVNTFNTLCSGTDVLPITLSIPGATSTTSPVIPSSTFLPSTLPPSTPTTTSSVVQITVTTVPAVPATTTPGTTAVGSFAPPSSGARGLVDARGAVGVAIVAGVVAGTMAGLL